MLSIINADCMAWLDRQIEEKKRFGAIFADPPDNLGLEYDGYRDKIDPQLYYSWLELLLLKSCKVAPIVWLSYYHKHDLEVKRIVRNLLAFDRPSWSWKQILWTYEFGQYREEDLWNGYRPIIRLTSPGAKLDMDAIRVPSVRMEMNDPRTCGPKVPGDVWKFNRIQGNNKERRSFHPTQHPEKLMERIMKMCPEGVFCDLFVGSGTTLRVARQLNREAIGIEQSAHYCTKIKEDLGLA